MKAILFAASALALVAAPALAQSTDTQTTTFTATVAPKCSIENGDSLIPLNSGNDVTDAEGRVINTISHAGGFGNIWCNGGSNTVEIIFKPLMTTASTTDTYSFVDRIDYTVAVHSLYSPTPITTVGADASAGLEIELASLSAFETGAGPLDDFVLTLIRRSDNKRQLAGAYSGQIVINVSASL